jgi:inosine/xanthosine triphosphatase
MKKIVVASKNPVKLSATLSGFQRMFPNEEFEIEGISAESGVSDQPMSDDETLKGARNRVANARTIQPNADYWVGLEGGIEKKDSDMEAFAWMAIESKSGLTGKGRTGVFFLPPKVAGLIESGMELGEADDVVFGRTNSKQEGGAIGLLTDNVIDRASYYTDAIIFALIPFKNPEYYS